MWTNVRWQQMQLYPPKKRKNNCSIANVATLSFCQLESWSFQWQFSPQFRGCPWAFKSRLVDGTKEFEWSSNTLTFCACVIPKNERITLRLPLLQHCFCDNYVWSTNTLTFSACVIPQKARITLQLPLLQHCFCANYAQIHWHFVHV